MRFEYIEPFAEAARKVMESLHCATLDRGAISLAGDGGIISGEVLVVVPLAGESEGNIILNMNTPTALKLTGRMGSTDQTALTPLGMDSLAELANMIIGNAASVLNDMGFDLRTLPPVIVTRTQAHEAVGPIEVCRIPLVTDCGDVTVHVALKNA